MKRTITPTLARQLAVVSQKLSGERETAVLPLIQQLNCLQIDPLNVVARNPLLVLWSRLGDYDPIDLETLLWDDKRLFEYWAHAASIVLTDDYPLYQPRMNSFAQGKSKWSGRVRDWLAVNQPFRRYILDELAQRGPLFANEIENRIVEPWPSSGWTNDRNVTVMLAFLWERGEIMVSRRLGKGFGLKKQWALADKHLPQWTDHQLWPQAQVVYAAAQKSLQALGVGTARHIENHFMRGEYPGLDEMLVKLEQDGRVHPLQISENGQIWPDTWYIHSDTLPLLEQLEAGDWQPRTTLISPFDNLICDRKRTETLFDFYYRSEIYTPKAKRKYGYYVMPILHGEQLIGRIDPKMDRKTQTLHIQAVHAEPDVPQTAETDAAITQVIAELAQFLDAKDIAYDKRTQHYPLKHKV